MQNSGSKNGSPRPLIRPSVQRLSPYVPGEQPKIKGLIKLNTNENPYGPSPNVLAAIQKAIDGRLRLYPNPTATRLREKLARWHHCSPDNIIVGNGSDELLALATRTFVEPANAAEMGANAPSRIGSRRSGLQSVGDSPGIEPSPELFDRSCCTVQFFHPSYSLYPVLAEIHGAYAQPIGLGKDFTLPSPAELEAKRWDYDAALTFVTTPNAPSGRGFSCTELDELCRTQRGVIVLDEAYVDFADEAALDLALRYPHVLVSRTFSKAYSLCSLRVGYFVGHPQLTFALHKVRDSYNVNGLGQVAAEATLRSLPYYRKNFRRIIASRDRLSRELTAFGFEVLPSQTNFILVRPPGRTAEWWVQALRERKILVRWFSQPEIRAYLRITVGSEAEVRQLLKGVRAIAVATSAAH